MLGSEYYLGVHHGLKFHRGQPAEPVLSAAAVIGSFDPGDDRQAKLTSGGPGFAVQHVVLQ